MRSDVTKILFDGEETVTMPLSVYIEIQSALRSMAGDTDLPLFSPVLTTPAAPSFDNLLPIGDTEDFSLPVEDFATGIE